MVETVVYPCTIYDADRTASREQVTINWSGEPHVIRSVGVPAQLHPNESVTVPGITFAPLSDPHIITCETTEEITLSWADAEEVSEGALVRPDPRRPTTWEATFRLGDIPLSRPRRANIRLIVKRVTPRSWFATATTAVSATAGAAFLVCGALMLAGGGFLAALGAFVSAAVAAATYAPVTARLSRRFSIPLPRSEEPVGSIPLPPIELVPVILRSETLTNPLIAAYCARVVEANSHIEILGLAWPISLDEGYVPALLHVRRGAELAPPSPDRQYSQVDELIRTDLSLAHLLGSEALSPEEAWERHRRLTIIGEVGAGKTTILQRLAMNLGRGPVLWNVAVPVVVALHSLSRRATLVERPLETLKSALAEVIAGDGADAARGEEARALLDRLIESGELSIFLDALDEVSGPAGEEKPLVDTVIAAVSEAAERWPRVRIVVTCRRASMDRYRRLPDSFVVAEVTPFDADGIRHFVRRYFAASPERAARLVDEIERVPRLRAMASTPLLLALLTLIFEQRGTLPNRRTELYRRCADLLLREWDAHRERDRFPRFLVEHKEDLLRAVAWELHVEGIRYVRYERLIAIIEEALLNMGLQPESAPEILREITMHHGLIRSYDTEWYGFVHFALQEYFTAECIERRVPLAAAIDRRHQAWWQEIIRLYAGRGDCTELILALLREREDLFHTNLRLAGECLAQGTAVEPDLRANVIGELHAVARPMRVPLLNTRFWQVLTQAGEKQYGPLLWEAVADPDLSIEVRTAIVNEMPSALAESFDDEAVERLSDEALPAPVRVAFAKALSGSRTFDGWERLTEMIGDEKVHEEVRAALAHEIGRVGRSEFIGAFERLVVDRAMPTEVRKECGWALRTLGATGVTLTVLEMLNDWHIEPPVRSSLASVVGELGEEEHVREIVSALTDARLPSSVRTSLAVSLKRFNSFALADALLHLLGDQKTDYGVRLAIADTLAAIAADVHRNGIRLIYNDRHVEEPIRTRLAVALGTLGERDVLPVLIRLMEDRSARPYLRLEAARILGGSPDTGIRDDMARILDSRSVDPLGQELAVLVLSLRNEPEAAVPLVDRLSDRQLPLATRVRMADALAALGSNDQIDRLVSLLPDRSFTAELRGRLALTIKRMGDARNRRTFERLVDMLPHTSDVPEVMTLLWHLSEQVGTPVFPAEKDEAPVGYPWLEGRTHGEKDATEDVEETLE